MLPVDVMLDMPLVPIQMSIRDFIANRPRTMKACVRDQFGEFLNPPLYVPPTAARALQGSVKSGAHKADLISGVSPEGGKVDLAADRTCLESSSTVFACSTLLAKFVCSNGSASWSYSSRPCFPSSHSVYRQRAVRRLYPKNRLSLAFEFCAAPAPAPPRVTCVMAQPRPVTLGSFSIGTRLWPWILDGAFSPQSSVSVGKRSMCETGDFATPPLAATPGATISIGTRALSSNRLIFCQSPCSPV